MAREWLQIQQEAAYGTPPTSPTRGTNLIVMRLDGGNAFTMRSVPMQEQIMYGGGVAIPALTLSDHQGLVGKLSVKLYASQAAFLLGWAATRINGAQTAPWTTTEPVGDLASCTVDHAIQKYDGTIKRRRYVGVKVAGFDIACSRDTAIATLSLDLVGATARGNQFDASADPTTTTPTNQIFANPAETDYPTDPYLFVNTASYAVLGPTPTTAATVGTVTIANGQITAVPVGSGGSGYLTPPPVYLRGGNGYGAQVTSTISGGVVTAFNIVNPGFGYATAPTGVVGSRAQFSSVALSVKNALDPRWFESRYVQCIRMLGRSSTFTLRNAYHAIPEDRDAFEGLGKMTSSLEFNNGTNTFLIDFQGTNVMASIEDDLALDKAYEQTISLQNYWDVTGAKDFALTFT